MKAREEMAAQKLQFEGQINELKVSYEDQIANHVAEADEKVEQIKKM